MTIWSNGYGRVLQLLLALSIVSTVFPGRRVYSDASTCLGDTWAAGRAVAARLREGGSLPIASESGATVFEW